MVTFDGWESRLYGDAMALPSGPISEDTLMHWRTKGSKNGVRRYQNTDGSWTPLGIKLRKEREGWGDTKKERKAEKRVEKAERKAAKVEARRASAVEKTIRGKTNKGLANLSDDELKRKIERAKLESEYKELTKSPVLKTGEKVVTILLNNWDKKEERELTKAKLDIDRARIAADRARIAGDVVRSKQQTKQERAKARQKFHESETMKQNRKAGLKIERQAGLKRAKKEYKESTFIGAFIKTHKEAKLAKIEHDKEVKAGTSFVESLIKSQRKVDKANKNLKKGQTKINYSAESYKGEHKAKDELAKQKQLVKTAEAVARQKEADKDKEYWIYRQGRKKSS